MINLASKKIKVVIVDDSETMRRFLLQLVAYEEDIEVVGSAEDPLEAREFIRAHNPDVLILDIEMPKMNGLTFLQHLIRLRAMPVVMNSSFTAKGASETLKALEIGAVDYICKPQSAEEVQGYRVHLLEKIRAAAQVDMKRRRLETPKAFSLQQKSKQPVTTPVQEVIGIGASTGGVEALTLVLSNIEGDSSPILIVQHIPAAFSLAFAERLNEISRLTVCEAQNGQQLQNGCAYIAPGGLQMSVMQRGKDFLIRIHDGPTVSGHKPSVDELFASIANLRNIKKKAVLLTGMGNDGAKGLKTLFEQGNKTAIQDKDTSVVWGMPSSALSMEPNHSVLPISSISKFCSS